MRECLNLLEYIQVPTHVIRHSWTVCGVALYLARRFCELGLELNLELIRAAALLHDITKQFSFNRPLDHALTGAKLLKKIGYPQIGSIVRQHVRISVARPPGRISEVEIVNYADKRVLEDQITTLDKRLEYILKRYGRTSEGQELIKENMAMISSLEIEIFSFLASNPSDLMNIDVEKECNLT
ncbi:MAG: HDIG domain-containing protein [Deltaproteobacteria bacterium]|nr:HDIG domain-containing protein [Deltaproteobacteria bacterium]